MTVSLNFIALPTSDGEVYRVRTFDIAVIRTALDQKTTDVVIVPCDSTPVTVSTLLTAEQVLAEIDRLAGLHEEALDRRHGWTKD